MIRAPDQGPEPDSFSSVEADDARYEAESFFQEPAAKRRQKTFAPDSSVYAADDVLDRLYELFFGKCGYCETPLTRAEVQVDQFRPSTGALDLDGNASLRHYSWLAYTWENLYPSCGDCQSFKGARFPVQGGRAVVGATGESLRKERALLLDPRFDHPERHLVYAEDGTVASTTPEGKTTIDVFGFNRAQLLSNRRAAFQDVQREWKALTARLQDPADTASASEVDKLFSTELPYAGLRRQFVNSWLQSPGAALAGALAPGEEGISAAAEDVLVVTKTERDAIKFEFQERAREQDGYSLDHDEAGRGYFGRTRRIERVVIRNFKVIRKLDLNLQTSGSESGQAPWLMLLGENGCGKSSVLQAVSLALMGDQARTRLKLEPASFVTNGARSGSVEIHLTASTPIRVEFSRQSPRFEGEGDPKLLLLGYGATRLLPRGTRTTPALGGDVRVENLFDPFSPIGSVTEWLLSFKSRGEFDVIATALKSLLDLRPDDRLIQNRRKGWIEVQSFGRRVPLERLSDGYQSVVALATDIMMILLRRWPSVDAAEGTVLIDELGAHIHPRWRMRIVSSLRRVFPRVQFISSTHDPLCLRGLGDGEVVLLRRDADDEIVAVADLPSPAGLRVDQLLGSEYFGLGSTVDPDIDAVFAEYYELKAKHDLNAAQRRRLDDLHTELEGKKVLGTTRRDRLVLEAADDFLASELELPSQKERTELRAATKEKIVEIWAETGPT